MGTTKRKENASSQDRRKTIKKTTKTARNVDVQRKGKRSKKTPKRKEGRKKQKTKLVPPRRRARSYRNLKRGGKFQGKKRRDHKKKRGKGLVILAINEGSGKKTKVTCGHLNLLKKKGVEHKQKVKKESCEWVRREKGNSIRTLLDLGEQTAPPQVKRGWETSSPSNPVASLGDPKEKKKKRQEFGM